MSLLRKWLKSLFQLRPGFLHFHQLISLNIFITIQNVYHNTSSTQWLRYKRSAIKSSEVFSWQWKKTNGKFKSHFAPTYSNFWQDSPKCLSRILSHQKREIRNHTCSLDILTSTYREKTNLKFVIVSWIPSLWL